MKLVRSYPFILSTALGFVVQASAADDSLSNHAAEFKKPAWLTDLSLGVKEGYDDNLLLVAGLNPGLQPKGSWITTVSPKVGFDFAPLFGRQTTLQTFSFAYAPDFAIYHDASAESYDAHRFGNSIKGKTGDFSFALDNAFLFNDGSSVAPTYALNQSATALDQADKNRSCYSTGAPRERRKQMQDRATVLLQYDLGQFFIRPVATLLYYDLLTDWHKATVAPYKGYQNYADRSDVNGGADLGYKLNSKLAVTVGYRYGHQYQQAFTSAVDSTYQSSSDYQRVLLGLEGRPWKWLNVKIAGGPDFRTYNDTAPMDHLNPITYYGEALLTATLTPNQTLTFTYKQWQWVSSTGKVPYFDSTYALNYHWNATKQLGFDLGGKVLEGDYTIASPVKTSNSCLRDDAQYTISAGVSYAFTKHFSVSAAYAYDLGRNLLGDLPTTGSPSAAATADYREFDHQSATITAQYRF
ncbi:MAG: hypothetical protein P4N60_09495 [Verrucomicrobiae bacterium]|nr:hypothetical protein [Verrucomicrobiae bacterium]